MRGPALRARDPMPRRFPFTLLAMLLLTACGGEDQGVTDPETPVDPADPPPVADVDGYVGTLGTWEDFSPLLPASDAATGPEVLEEEVVGNTTYECSVTPRSITATPQEIVMYEPNASIMWVGNLIQGKSYKGGTGSFEELSIRQRAPLKISIDLLTGDNFAIVENPSLTSVQAAIGDLIQRATDAGHLSGSSIHYESMRIHTAVEAMLRLGISANFIGQGVPIELSGNSEYGLDASITGVMAHFTQKMFTISIELPQSPSAVFSDDLTPALLQQQVDAGNIGPDNLPVYIASITYGRTLTYSMWTADVEARMHSAVEASIAGFKKAGSAYTEAELRATLSTDKLKVTSIGGEGVDVINLIREGQLGAYFTDDAPLTTARPLSYQLNFLGDNSIAKVSETSAYDLRTCTEKVTSPGVFDFRPIQTAPVGLATPYNVHGADVNGDGRGDIVLNHLISGDANQVVVGLGAADGTFAFGSVIEHPVLPSHGWGNSYVLLVGDFDGDGQDDLAWDRRRDVEPDSLYVALSDGSGSFQFLPAQSFRATWATGWTAQVGDVDGDGDDDLVVNVPASHGNYSHALLSDGDGTFTLVQPEMVNGGNWSPFAHVVADVDGDAKDDIVWNNVPASTNDVRVARSNGDGTFIVPTPQIFGGGGWEPYQPYVGDVNGDGRADMVWTTGNGPVLRVHRGLGQASGQFSWADAERVDFNRPDEFADEPADIPALIGDFNGDGRSDVLFNDLNATGNHLLLGFGATDGGVDFTVAVQSHPATGVDWTQFQPGVLVLDVNGDGVDDIVWSQPAATNTIYVALGQ